MVLLQLLSIHDRAVGVTNLGVVLLCFGVHSIERFIIGNVTNILWTIVILDLDITNIFTRITRIFIVIVINVLLSYSESVITSKINDMIDCVIAYLL